MNSEPSLKKTGTVTRISSGRAAQHQPLAPQRPGEHRVVEPDQEPADGMLAFGADAAGEQALAALEPASAAGN